MNFELRECLWVFFTYLFSYCFSRALTKSFFLLYRRCAVCEFKIETFWARGARAFSWVSWRGRRGALLQFSYFIREGPLARVYGTSGERIRDQRIARLKKRENSKQRQKMLGRSESRRSKALFLVHVYRHLLIHVWSSGFQIEKKKRFFFVFIIDKTKAAKKEDNTEKFTRLPELSMKPFNGWTRWRGIVKRKKRDEREKSFNFSPSSNKIIIDKWVSEMVGWRPGASVPIFFLARIYTQADAHTNTSSASTRTPLRWLEAGKKLVDPSTELVRVFLIFKI